MVVEEEKYSPFRIDRIFLFLREAQQSHSSPLLPYIIVLGQPNIPCVGQTVGAPGEYGVFTMVVVLDVC